MCCGLISKESKNQEKSSAQTFYQKYIYCHWINLSITAYVILAVNIVCNIHFGPLIYWYLMKLKLQYHSTANMITFFSKVYAILCIHQEKTCLIIIPMLWFIIIFLIMELLYISQKKRKFYRGMSCAKVVSRLQKYSHFNRFRRAKETQKVIKCFFVPFSIKGMKETWSCCIIHNYSNSLNLCRLFLHTTWAQSMSLLFMNYA